MLLVKSGVLSYQPIIHYFGTINFRMIAIPSVALDVYNDFFSTHDLTHFCQISFLKPFVDCPYNDPLSIVMEKAYHLGNLNASLFATEGIASVGPVLAPLAVLACGLVISLANRLSSGLPPEFVLVVGRRSSAGLSERAAYDDLADKWRRFSVPAVVRNPAHDVRTEAGQTARCCVLIGEAARKHGLANRADCLTIDDPNPTDYHSAPAE